MMTNSKRLIFSLLIVISTAAIAKADIVPSPKLPATTPWDFKTLSQTPQFEWVDDKGPVRSLFYAGEPFGGKPTRVFAYYASPATLGGFGKSKIEEKYPAVVLVHGGGGTAFREWAELWAKRGYAAIAMDLAGSQPIEGKNAHALDSRTRLPDGGPNHGDEDKFGSIDKPPTEQWPYHAVASVLRAHSLIRSFPEVDAERTAVTGISWGGYLTCIVAGVDNRFKAAVPVYGCGFLDEDSAWLPKFEAMSAEQRRRWVTLWDPSQYLPAVSMPIFFINGTNDFAYPLDSYMKCYDSITAPKQIRVTVNMPHGHPPGWEPKEIGLFIDQYLRGGTPLPEVGTPKLTDGKVQFECTGAPHLTLASLHFTTDGGAINARTWQTQKVALNDGTSSIVSGNTYTLPAPPVNATAWFVTVDDDRQAIVSSRVAFNDSEETKTSFNIGKRLQNHLPVRIVCFGDSVTGVYYHTGGRRAYTDMLGLALKKLYPNADVTMFNAGISGHTTADGLARIERDVLAHKPTVVTVMFGLNDMARIPLDQYRANLKTIIEKCRSVGAEVILCTPNNVITTTGRPVEKLETYCDAVREVGQAENAIVCDCYRGLEVLRQQDALKWRMLLSDEIHPNMDGHKRLAELIARTIGGRDVSLADVPPPADPLAKTIAKLKASQPVKILAMPPFDELIGPALNQLAADAKLEIVSWPTTGKTLPQLEEEAKAKVRAMKPDLVLIAIPRSAAAESTESFIHSYSWVMNSSLSFGTQEWDCVVFHPSVADPQLADAQHDEMARQLIRAQDLTLIDRKPDDKSTPAEILSQWLATQTPK